MPREVVDGERSGGHLTRGRTCEIEEGRGEPATEQERAEFVEMHKVLKPIAAELRRQVNEIDPDALAAAGEVQRRWPELTPSQRRRFGKVKIRHAESILRPLPRQAVLHAPQPRENVATRPRERRSPARARSSARGSPDDPSDPEPEPVAFIRGFAAASERLSRHLQRRAAARYLA